MALPDFSTMTAAEIATWIDTHDTTELIQRAQPGPAMSPSDKPIPVVSSVSVTFRAPVEMVEQLDAFAGRDREGRSGVVRRAMAEFVERHRAELG
jgi:hypothetical protein